MKGKNAVEAFGPPVQILENNKILNNKHVGWRQVSGYAVDTATGKRNINVRQGETQSGFDIKDTLRAKTSYNDLDPKNWGQGKSSTLYSKTLNILNDSKGGGESLKTTQKGLARKIKKGGINSLAESLPALQEEALQKNLMLVMFLCTLNTQDCETCRREKRAKNPNHSYF